MILDPFNCLFIDVHRLQAVVGLETPRDHVVKKLDVPNISKCTLHASNVLPYCISFVFFRHESL